jgi:parvulin-like peptidyl-prolyl isomerase
MKRFLLGATALVLAAAPIRAQSRDTTIKLDAIVAVVGTVPITQYDILRRLQDSVGSLLQRGLPMPPLAAQKAMVTATLTDLIDEEVMLYRAKEMSVEVTDIEINAAVEQQMKDIASRYPSDADFRRELLKAGFGTPEDFRRVLTTNFRRDRTIRMLVERLHEEKKIPMVNVAESKVQEEFDRLKTAGQIPMRLAAVAWRQMVVAPAPSAKAKAAAKAKIDSIRVELKAGGDFERIAKRESMDIGTKDLGGDLGWRRRGSLPQELERVLFGAFAIRPGEISNVIESPFGFHVIRLDRAHPPAEVKARQILIIPKIDSADVVAAGRLADSLAGAIRRGEPFDTTARRHHDLAEDAPGLIPDTPYDSLPGSYQLGLKDVKKDSIVTFSIPTALGYPKFVIAQVVGTTESGQYTFDEVKARIRAQLQQISQMRRYIDQQRALMYVKVFEDRAMEAIKIFEARPPG